mmetsp:Transcript_14580/g.25816  ORF Transcript_14580/g.25816 Transcript_14580/m.25816 type:complete len:263 (+) Transcript_14580:75-863(+)
MGKHTTSGLGGFMSGASIRFSKLKNGSGGVDAWRDQLGKIKPGTLQDRKRTYGTAIPALNSIHQGIIVSLYDYGGFVQIGDGNTYKDALVHVSNITGTTRYETAEEAGLALGMMVWVKCCEIREEEVGTKYSLDMRFVDQRNGNDLDPHQGRGAPPDNFFVPSWNKKRAKELELEEAWEKEQAAEPSAASDRAAPEKKRKRRKEKSTDSESEEISDVEAARAKMNKKLEKAKKKLEKAKKKAEKVKKKLKKKKKSSSSADSA